MANTHPGMLLAYDKDYNVIATLDFGVQYAPNGEALGLIDFAAHEEAGGEMTDLWFVNSSHPDSVAIGSKVWPEYIGGAAHQFTVELIGPPGQKHINALVHKKSGYRRERATIENAINGLDLSQGPAKAAIDLFALVGTPNHPLRINSETGETEAPGKAYSLPPLPLVPIGQDNSKKDK